MTDELQKIALSAENLLQQAQQSFNLTETTIRKLKAFISGHTFKDEAEEIRFFKEIKPRFQRELIYNEELLYFEAGRPVGSQKATKQFVGRQLARIEAFFERNNYFYNYYRSADSSLDDQYFVRNVAQVPLQPVSQSDMDDNFSNPFSYKLAKIQAFEQLKNHIIAAASKPSTATLPESGKKGKKRVWTGPKAAAHEIIRGIVRKGWINAGNESIIALTEDFEEFFNCKLGNGYRVFVGMTLRKKDYTPHLRGMMDAIVDEIDEKHS